VVCLDLACSEYGCPLDRAAAIKLAAVTRKVYIESLKHLGATLYPHGCVQEGGLAGVRVCSPTHGARRTSVTFRQLAVQFGCAGLVAGCERLHARCEHSSA
jgi:hypothetical protein